VSTLDDEPAGAEKPAHVAPLGEQLADLRVLITGVTGFVGEALLARLLADLPQTRLMLLIRPKGVTSGADRLRRLVKKPAFAALRESVGADAAGEGAGDALEGLLAERVTVIEGDLSAVPELPGDLDVVIHCAGDVAFDPPIDAAFDTNVGGTERLLRAVQDSGSRPHYVHVSTAYVAGRRRGVIPETRLDHDVDWRAEAAAARDVRAGIEAGSRTPDRLARLRSAAEREHRRAGALTAAADTEKRRQDWVAAELVRAGTERARSLGWTDVYTYTKAMGERCVEDTAADLPVSVVRPSIIESAERAPHPGWIEGFKMAEPLILAYARGDMPEFPAPADGIIDIIPVDHVVNAILAVAATRPAPGEPAYFHVASSARNPLGFHRLYELCKAHFAAHPFEQPNRGHAPARTFSWPGSHALDQRLRLAERAHAGADGLVGLLPRSAWARDRATDLHRAGRKLEFLRRYFDLYRPYVEAELHFADERTLALHRSLSPADRASFGFDSASVDWASYIDTHCAAVTAPMRTMTKARGRRRPARGAPRELPAGGGAALAAFDMDGTMLASNVVESYLWLRLREQSALGQVRTAAETAVRLPGLLIAERRDRTTFLRSAYRPYAGASLAELERIVDADVADVVLGKVSAAALRQVRRHRAVGHRTVLVTGAIRPLTRPLASLFDEIVAADLAVDAAGRATGFLAHPPVVGESRAAWLHDAAVRAGADPGDCYAYADSHSDLPLLRAVGHPVAVDPDVALSRVARKNRWPVEHWRAGAVRPDRRAVPAEASR
jgi:HAD superfamily hydrolase (TIGR01490 family)